MGVRDLLVAVRVGVWLGDGFRVVVAVVLVVDVQVLVLDRFVEMDVLVPLPDEQRDAASHQRRGDALPQGEALPEEGH
jgi:hypothetical protein